MLLLATCCPGLEPVLMQEAARRLGASAASARGRVTFDAPADAALGLRCADNVYAVAGTVRAARTRPELEAMCAALCALPLRDILRACGVKADAVHVSASRAGKHSYSRFEAAQGARAALARALGARQGGEGDGAQLRLDIVEDAATLSVKLTSPEFRFRGRRDFAPAALRPTVAHALVLLSEPRDGDVFVDPFCGSGTILLERAQYPAASIRGGDIDRAVVDIAAAQGADARVWDARALSRQASGVTALVSNPPWGGQIPGDVGALYAAFMSECARALAPGARVVLLTPHDEVMISAAEGAGLPLERALTLSLHGTVTYVLKGTLGAAAL